MRACTSKRCVPCQAQLIIDQHICSRTLRSCSNAGHMLSQATCIASRASSVAQACSAKQLSRGAMSRRCRISSTQRSLHSTCWRSAARAPAGSADPQTGMAAGCASDLHGEVPSVPLTRLPYSPVQAGSCQEQRSMSMPTQLLPAIPVGPVATILVHRSWPGTDPAQQH